MKILGSMVPRCRYQHGYKQISVAPAESSHYQAGEDTPITQVQHDAQAIAPKFHATTSPRFRAPLEEVKVEI
jgi:hypothetical protein